MKRILTILLSLIIMMTLTAYSGSQTDSTDESESVQQEESTAQTDTQTAETGAKDMTLISIDINGTTYTAQLKDNEAAQELYNRLPLTLDMDELHGNEKYAYLDQSLPTASEKVGSIKSGDLMLFGSDCLVLFYEDFSTSYSYTPLGHIDDPAGLSDALGSGSVLITVSASHGSGS